MKKNNLVLGSVVFFLLSGCGSGTSPKATSTDEENQVVFQINLEKSLKNTSEVHLSDIADTICYIELKTPRDLPIGVITNIKISKDYIFILST